MANQEDSITVKVIGSGLGTSAGIIQGLIAEAYKKNPSIAAGLALAKVTVVAVAADTLTVAIAVQSGDPDRIGKASAAAVGSIALSTIAAIATGAVGLTGVLPIVLVGGLGYFGGELGEAWWNAYKYGALPANTPGIDGDPFTGMPWPGISPTVNTATTGALTWQPPRMGGRGCPLILDLDGGGISNSGIAPGLPILFDHDGDGLRNATGWVGAGEAIVVRDLNGNGTIDSGRELFGDNTLLTRGPKAGQRAANGFEALADLDSNNDGQFNAADAAFASVKLWKDANQNGISEAGELFTFAQLGVQGIKVAAKGDGTQLTDADGELTGNRQILAGTFTWGNGGNGQAGTTALAADLTFTTNAFYRRFSDDPTLTVAALALPNMQGSGLVRDLRAAISLGNAQATQLQTSVTQFAAMTTRAQQWGAVDELIYKWGNTSAMPTSVQTNRVTSTTDVPNSLTAIEQFAVSNPTLYKQITALEQFNGTEILSRWVQTQTVSAAWQDRTGTWFSRSWTESWVEIAAPRRVFVDTAYAALRDGVYGAMAMQTRLRPYLEAVELVIDANGVRFDTAALLVFAQARAGADRLNAVSDLVDLGRYAGDTARAIGWDRYQTLATVLDAAPLTPAIQAFLTEQRLQYVGAQGTNLVAATADGATLVGNAASNVLTGGDGADALHGLAGDDKLYGGAGNDTLEGGTGADVLRGGDGADLLYGGAGSDDLEGGAGNDTLFGDEGNDLLAGGDGNDWIAGGAGNDTIDGGGGSDTYVFGRGDGQDTLADSGLPANGVDVIRLRADVAVADVQLRRDRTNTANLVLEIAGTTDSLTILGQLGTDPWSADSVIESVIFSDGTVGNRAKLATAKVLGTSGNDSITGNGNNETFEGGAGQDALTGSDGSDTYLFGRGDGQDTVAEAWQPTQPTGVGVDIDVIRLAAGIAPSDIILRRDRADTANLVVEIAGTNDRVTVLGQFDPLQWGVAGGAIEQIVFDDGTVWGTAQMAAAKVIGTSGNDSITGNANSEYFEGGAGNDTINGDYGADTLDGGAGNDLLKGGYEGDTYLFGRGDGQDVVDEEGYAGEIDTLRLKAGVATGDVTLRRDWSNTANLIVEIAGTTDSMTVLGQYGTDYMNIDKALEKIVFADGTTWGAAQMAAAKVIGTSGNDSIMGNANSEYFEGGAGNDTINGDLGADTLDGGAGNDLLKGGYAGDTYLFGRGDGQDVVDEEGSSGEIDTLRLKAGVAVGDVTLRRDWSTGNLIVAIAGTTDSVTVVGQFADQIGNYTGYDKAIEKIVFADGTTWGQAQLAAVEIVGSAGADQISGGSGNDFIRGGGGNDVDTLIGGQGNDTYIVDSTTDVITEALSEGTDTVQSSVTYTLGANLENLTLTGLAAINGTGNGLNNVLTGSSAANVLDGGAGVDTLMGGQGNDTYIVDSTTDVITENLNEGTDLVQSSVSYALGANLENLTLTGTAAINGTGNELNNVLTGNTAANVLDGGVGADTMAGGAGDDVYLVDNTGDVVNEGASAGTDLVQSSVNYTLSVNVENLTLTGAAAINGTGNTANNVLTGNSAANVLNGGAGADVLVGGAGNDTYLFGRGWGADTIQENDATAGNRDVLQFTAGISRDQLWFRKVADSLEVSVIGSTDKMTVSNWYLGDAYHVEQFKTSDGKTLLDSQVQNLVNAMAALAPPAAGQSTLPAAYATALTPGIGGQLAVALARRPFFGLPALSPTRPAPN